MQPASGAVDELGMSDGSIGLQIHGQRALTRNAILLYDDL